MCLRMARLQARLVLEPDERHDPVEGRPRAPASSPARNRADDVDEQLREPEPGHRPDRAAPQLLEEHDRRRGRRGPAGRVGPPARRPTLGGLGSSSSLMTRHDGDASAIVARTSDGHRHAAARRVVLDHDRDARWRRRPRGSGRRPPRRWAGPGPAARASPSAPRPPRRARAKATARSVPAWLTPTQTGRSPAAARTPSMTCVPLVVAEPARLAEHAQDRHAVDAAIGDEAGQRRQAVDVERAVGLERGRDDRPDPFEPLDARRSPVDRLARHRVGRARQHDQAGARRPTGPGRW